MYKNSPERKQAAVEAVRKARAQGIEAYYLHASDASAVCIGAWPAEAATIIDPAMQNDDPNAPLFVTAQPIPEPIAKEAEAHGMKPIAPQLQILDPTLADALRRFPEFAVNGEVLSHRVIDPATKQERFENDPSCLIEGPFRNTDERASGSMARSSPPPPRASQPDVQPGLGRLKSIGD